MQPFLTSLLSLSFFYYSSLKFNLVFTTRKGGISRGKYKSLNLSYKVGDEPERVEENWRRVARSLNLDYRSFTFPQQVHGKKIALAGARDLGKGTLLNKEKISGVDGLFTEEFNLPICVLTADCLPIVITDSEESFAGVIHAGWRGLKSGIIFNAVDFAKKNFGVDPKFLKAWIGPSIGACCYEIGENIISSFLDYPFALKKVEGKHFLDLKFLGRWQLLESGLKESEVWVFPNCTFCEKDLFYSYRRDRGKTGRQAAIAWLSLKEERES
jgi:hypothetical protein